jgi:hypothetical protein
VTGSFALSPKPGEQHGLVSFADGRLAVADRAPALRQMPQPDEPDQSRSPTGPFRKANLRMSELRIHRNQDRPGSSHVERGQPAGGLYQAAGMSDDLGLIQIAMRVGMCCALTAVGAVGIFMIIRFVAWTG